MHCCVHVWIQGLGPDWGWQGNKDAGWTQGQEAGVRWPWLLAEKASALYQLLGFSPISSLGNQTHHWLP